MSRVKGGIVTRRRHQKLLNAVKGYRGARSRLFRTAVDAYRRGRCYAYHDRRLRKREFRYLWIARINAAARMNGTKYSELMNMLARAGMALDRKVLAGIAVDDPQAFSRIVEAARQRVGQ